MGNIMSPEIHLSMDSFFLQYLAQSAGAFLQRIFPCSLTDNDQDLSVILHFDIVMIPRQIPQIMNRTVVIDKIIHIIPKELLRIV